MNVEKMIMKGKIEPIPDELDIKNVIEKSRHVFLKQEENKNTELARPAPVKRSRGA